MRRIAILTAGGDTPALNATIYGAVTRANQLKVDVYGIIKGYSGLLNPEVPHVHLNPMYSTIPELDPCKGGTLLGASRDYIDPEQTELIKRVAHRLMRMGIEGLICIGGDGTINGMQPLANYFPCVLAPKTIDNDLGLNYTDEPNDWVREPADKPGKFVYHKIEERPTVRLDDIVNYATPGYATAVYVAASGIERIRTTAESHRRIAIIEVMGRQSGYISLGSAYGQPDIILIPEVWLDFARLERKVRELYELQKHAVIVIGEGVRDEHGHELGAAKASLDPAGNVIFNGAAETLADMLANALGDQFFSSKRRHDKAKAAIFTRKVGHTQRGGRPILFDRTYAAQLGGKAVDLVVQGYNNSIATLQWTETGGFQVDSIHANSLRDKYNIIRPREVHKSFYDPQRFQPSVLGIQYLRNIFTDAIGWDDMESMRGSLFHPGNLTNRYQSINVAVNKRIKRLPAEGTDDLLTGATG